MMVLRVLAVAVRLNSMFTRRLLWKKEFWFRLLMV